MKARKGMLRGATGLVALVLVAGTACSDADAASPLANAKRSERAVVQAALDAIGARDEAALKVLKLDREEYETLLWPELPDREQMPFDFAWSMNEAVSRKGMRQAIERWGGLELEVVSVEFTREPEVYPSFTLHRGARVVARRLDTGETGVVESFDVIVEYGGGWKLLDFDEL